MSDHKKAPGEREMTYQVGWKRGKIVVPEGAAHAGHAKSGAKTHVLLLEDGGGRLLRRIWHPAPFLPGAAALALLVSLPAISFAVTLWLVYQLSR